MPSQQTWEKLGGISGKAKYAEPFPPGEGEEMHTNKGTRREQNHLTVHVQKYVKPLSM